ncbi:hypothetical protein [Deinococcus humi]|uniref:PepSY domain-containing protein n=1 Tax=Deinococcus humi TaxID=662880 RepID=A0A7W8JYS1_9DEIO|nr:hypothetical protein [Deinococcus humi]MBB5364413.1 hypothetical protein [Deinococcus humi]GGO33210.1 hypothetical protein GCM10008949_32050 [Deinococcus humi]
MKHLVLASMLTLSAALAQTATPPGTSSHDMTMPGKTMGGDMMGGDMNAMMKQCMQMMQAGDGNMMARPATAPGLDRPAAEAVARAFLQGQGKAGAGTLQITEVRRSGNTFQVGYLQGKAAGVLHIDATTGNVTVSRP